ncbi:hypothetical protein BGZ52_003967 [Haplosporangium bisporale]|nr:hypothetical protein BGZ52_003967 [Haplosporangium bisporale]KFH68823.1 hypothetical protein MVEG_05627 [Podila verticillata NRRL 6337]
MHSSTTALRPLRTLESSATIPSFNHSTHPPSTKNLYTFLITLSCLLALSPLFAQAQTQSQSPTVYKPVAYAASSVLADGGFYLYGGVVQFALTPTGANQGSNQFLRLDLTQSFDTNSPPWETLKGYLSYTMLSATPSQSGKQIVFGGNRDYPGTLSYIYDIASRNWTTTPNIPGMESSMAGYKRSNIGMQLDPVTGLVYMYGGLQYMSFSNEINVLDTSDPDPSKAKWTVTKNQTIIPALYEPFVLFLPSRNQTLVMAGCDNFNTVTGFVRSCAPLNIGYLLSNGTSNNALQIQNQTISNGPSPRYQACRVVLQDGNVFVHGGRDQNSFFGDAWVLHVDTWVWQEVMIQGPTDAMTRAGHSCELGPHDQIIIVGGFVQEAGISRYVQPYVAVINTKGWEWKTSFLGSELSDGGLSNGAKVGIGIGALAAMVLFGAGALYCFRRRKNGAYFSTAPSFALPTIEKEAKSSTSRATTEESPSSKIKSESSLELHSSRPHSPYATPRIQTVTRVNTVHTPVMTSRESDVRPLSGPQSVPESDAFFERSSPGVRTHYVGPQDLDGDGLYPPLTPTSQYASPSIVIGVPPHLSSTTGAGSMSGSSRYHEGGSPSMPGSPSVYSPKSVPYWGTQKERDLSAIIQRIESESRMELQNPHAVVQSEPEIEEHKVEIDEKGTLI